MTDYKKKRLQPIALRQTKTVDNKLILSCYTSRSLA